VKHGTNRGGTKRCRCKTCNKTFTPEPNPRRLDPKIEQAIERALDERLAFLAIKRTFKVGWDTIARIAAAKSAQANPANPANPATRRGDWTQKGQRATGKTRRSRP